MLRVLAAVSGVSHTPAATICILAKRHIQLSRVFSWLLAVKKIGENQ